MLTMSGANARQDSNSKVIETTIQPAIIVGASEKKDSLRILHVDDDSSILETSKLILMDMSNFEIDTANCVNEAFKKLEQQKYDAIISDYEMPQKNGLDFLKELRDQKMTSLLFYLLGKAERTLRLKL